ncbi:MAG: protein kinase [Desulforhopalus sp.]
MNEITTHIPLSPGTVLGGGYQIIRLIGKGGMGAVYMAYDVHLDLKVAIKVISPGVLETMEPSEYEVALKRFQAEAKIVAQVDHPNVIRVLGFKQDTIEYDGQSCKIDYLVMELMAERTLRDTMDESGFEFEEEVRAWITKFMVPVLEGLEEVHKRGIVHRDIKPENIFMKENTAKLADFGLSMGFDFPSVTGSVAEIFGTLAYMAPEQYSNFSLARESADIFAIGRILFEVVEGKITEKITPFKQVQLSDTTSEYYKSLNHVIMAATAENPMERIGSVRDLRYRLIDIHTCPLNAPSVPEGSKEHKWKVQALMILLIAGVFGLGLFSIKLYVDSKSNILPETQNSIEVRPIAVNQPVYGLLPKDLKPSIQAAGHSILRLVPSMELELEPENPFGEKEISIDAFYLSESPVTNEQYVEFLNTNLDSIEYMDNDVLLDGRLVLKLSEKIRDYKPIVFDGDRFHVKHPMHSSCAVLMVTGDGAEAYARYFGFRLVKAKEWFALMMSNESSDTPRLPLPTPVINYPQEKFGIRGINQVAEWGKSKENDFLILGLSVSDMLGNTFILKKDQSKYYTDTSFRVAKDVAPKGDNKQP